MSSIILPRRYSAKPPPGVGVDWSNPLTQGLFDCVLFAEGGGTTSANAAAPAAGGSSVNGAGWAVTPAGVAGNTSNPTATGSSGQSWDIANHGQLFAGFGNVTWRIVHQPTSWPAAFTALLDDSGASRNILIDIGATGDLSYLQLGTIGTNTSIPLGMTAGVVWDLVVTLENGTTVTFYVNGARKGTLTMAGVNGISGSTVHLGRTPSGSDQCYYGSYLAYQSWSRALSASEVQTLYAQPNALLAPQRRLWAVGAAGGGPAITSGSGTVTAGAQVAGTGNVSPAVMAASGLLAIGVVLSGSGTAIPARVAATGTLTSGVQVSGAGSSTPAIRSATGIVTAGVALSGGGASQPAVLAASGALTAGAQLSGSGTAQPAIIAAAGSVTAGAHLSGTGTVAPAIVSASGALTSGVQVVGNGSIGGVIPASGALTSGAQVLGTGMVQPAVRAAAGALTAGAQITGAGTTQPAILAASGALTSGVLLSGSGTVGGGAPVTSASGALTAGVTLSGNGVIQPAIVAATGIVTSGVQITGAAPVPTQGIWAAFRSLTARLAFRSRTPALAFRSSGGLDMPMEPVTPTVAPYVLRSHDRNRRLTCDYSQSPNLGANESVVSAVAFVTAQPGTQSGGAWIPDPAGTETDVTTTVVPGASSTPVTVPVVANVVTVTLGPGAVAGQLYRVYVTATTNAGQDIEDVSPIIVADI